MLLWFLLALSCNSLFAATLTSEEQLQSNHDELELNQNETLEEEVCIFENLPLHNEMTNFIGELVLKLIQTTLTTGSKYIKKLIKELGNEAVNNQALQQRLQLYGQQTEEIEKSPLLLLTNLNTPADLSVLMHFFDDRVPLQRDASAVLPKLSKLYENVLSALQANAYKPSPEDRLIEKTLMQIDLSLMNKEMATDLAKFVSDYQKRQQMVDMSLQLLSNNSTCEAVTQFLNFYKTLQAPKSDLLRLAKVMLITTVVLKQT